MRILWVKPGKLLPLDTGGKLRTYNILRHLSKEYAVTYLSYYGADCDPRYEQEIVEHLPGTVSLHGAGPSTNGFERYLHYALRLPSSVPYSVSRFTAPNVRRWITDNVTAERFDVAVCDFLASTLNFPKSLAIPVILFQHNVESVLWRRRARVESKWMHRVSAEIEYVKMARFEPRQLRRFHHVFAVSDHDREVMSGMMDREKITVIPTGVDVAKFSYNPELRPARPLVVFAGSMDWAPRLGSSSVEVTGTVPSVEEHFREAAVLVVPLRIGGGTRIKIYEGMAMGKATVSTSLGAEGLDVVHGRDILLADDPRMFAEHVSMLLCNRERRRVYEAAAATTAQKYDWSVVTRHMVDAIRRVVAVPAYAQPPSVHAVADS